MAMRKLKIQFLKGYNLLLSLLLAALGCTEKEPVCEYGTPHATFIVKGTVRSKTNAQPVPKVKVEMNYDSPESGTYSSALSDNNGNYEVKTEDFPNDQTFSMKFTDPDGAVNGLYLEKDTVVEFKNPVFTGGDGNWYDGETKKELHIKLTPGE
jgi:putative lipoprotein (rSAM/lipoprotein system)